MSLLSSRYCRVQWMIYDVTKHYRPWSIMAIQISTDISVVLAITDVPQQHFHVFVCFFHGCCTGNSLLLNDFFFCSECLCSHFDSHCYLAVKSCAFLMIHLKYLNSLSCFIAISFSVIIFSTVLFVIYIIFVS